MTSGAFASIPLSSITINRAERQRRVLDEQYIRSLADSINQRGLIHPPIIRRDSNELVVGECRLEACKLLGWTHIAIQYIDELDSASLRAVELEENIRRKAIEWKDECLAVKELHDLHRAEDPAWTLEDTGKILGYSATNLFKKLDIAKELLAGNERVIAAPMLSTATGIIERTRSRAKTAASVAIAEAINPAPSAEPDPIITADFREWAKTYTGPKFNFIHCDFPYGIGADKFVQGAADTHGGYDDSKEIYFDLLHSLCTESDRLCDDSCHIMFWFSMRFYSETIDVLERLGFWTLDRYPLVWLKSDNVGIIPDPARGPRRIYETAFFGSRGDRKVVSSIANAFAGPTDRGEHMSIKPDAVLGHFFKMFVDPSTTMLDPTSGSGSALRAAQKLGARLVTGIESNPEFADRARLSLKASRLKP